MARKTGRGLPAPNGASAATPAATFAGDLAEPEAPSIRSRGRRSSGPSRSSAYVVDLQPKRLGSVAPPASGRPPACGRRNADSSAAQRFERAEHVERRNAAARSVRDVAIDRQHDRRPVVRVDQLRRDDADDAAVPAFAGHDQHVRAPIVGIGVDDLLRAAATMLGLFRLAPQCSRRSAARASARASSRQRFVGRPAAAGSAMSGVLMRPAALMRGASMKPT